MSHWWKQKIPWWYSTAKFQNFGCKRCSYSFKPISCSLHSTTPIDIWFSLCLKSTQSLCFFLGVSWSSAIDDFAVAALSVFELESFLSSSSKLVCSSLHFFFAYMWLLYLWSLHFCLSLKIEISPLPHFLSTLICTHLAGLLSEGYLWYWPCLAFSSHFHFVSAHLHIIQQRNFLFVFTTQVFNKNESS